MREHNVNFVGTIKQKGSVLLSRISLLRYMLMFMITANHTRAITVSNLKQWRRKVNRFSSLDLSMEPNWQQHEDKMLECLYLASGGLFEEYSSSAWAIWEIARLRSRINDLGAYADELEKKVDDRT